MSIGQARPKLPLQQCNDDDNVNGYDYDNYDDIKPCIYKLPFSPLIVLANDDDNDNDYDYDDNDDNNDNNDYNDNLVYTSSPSAPS